MGKKPHFKHHPAEAAPAPDAPVAAGIDTVLPEGPPEAAKIARAQMLELVTKAGLALVSERADLLPYQTFLVFRKPG